MISINYLINDQEMKTALISLAFAFCLLIFFFTRVNIYSSSIKDTIDIYFHDTIYVIAKFDFYLFLFLFISTFSFIGGAIETRFKNRRFLIGMVILLVIDNYLFV